MENKIIELQREMEQLKKEGLESLSEIKLAFKDSYKNDWDAEVKKRLLGNVKELTQELKEIIYSKKKLSDEYYKDEINLDEMYNIDNEDYLNKLISVFRLIDYEKFNDVPFNYLWRMYESSVDQVYEVLGRGKFGLDKYVLTRPEFKERFLSVYSPLRDTLRKIDDITKEITDVKKQMSITEKEDFWNSL